MTIPTDHLDLIPLTPAFLRASLNHDLTTAAHLSKLTLPSFWPDCEDVLSLRLAQLEADPSLQPWLLRAIALRSTGEMIGHIGFHTAPAPEYLQPYSPGAVEFGFTVFPLFRRHGFAQEASLALMNWAHQNHGVTKFIMTISPDNVPSQALAAKLGFIRIGSHLDEVDGPEDILELKR